MKKKRKRLRDTQAFIGIIILDREVKSFCCLFFLKLQRKDKTLIVDPVSFRDVSADSSVQNSGQLKHHLCLFEFIQLVVPNTVLTFLR